MSELDCLIAQLRAAAHVHGLAWLQDNVVACLQGVQQSPPQPGPATPRAQGSRPLERSSPERTPRAQRRNGSPPSDPSDPLPSARLLRRVACLGGIPSSGGARGGWIRTGTWPRSHPPWTGFRKLACLAMLRSACQLGVGQRDLRAPALSLVRPGPLRRVVGRWRRTPPGRSRGLGVLVWMT